MRKSSMWKKTMACVMAAVIAVSACGCGNEENSNESGTGSSESTGSSQSEDSSSDEEASQASREGQASDEGEQAQ